MEVPLTSSKLRRSDVVIVCPLPRFLPLRLECTASAAGILTSASRALCVCSEVHPCSVWLYFCLASNVLWDGLLTPEGSEGVPTDLRILHDMIALLQENKIRKR